jgi:8-oxo-dGTP pyrophosphatase MutT (NUDIX family)
MRLSVKLRRAAVRCAYVGLRTYWFLVRPKVIGVKCVLNHGDHVLLVRHTYGRRSWDLPGGTVRRGEQPIAAARREMREELGRRLDDWQELGVLHVNADHHDDNLHIFQTSVRDRQLDIDLSELAEAAWFLRDDLPPDIGRFVHRILTQARLASEF